MSKELYRSRLLNFILLLLFAFLFFGGLYISRDFLIPISFAALLAMLLHPLVSKLDSWKVPQGLSITLALLLLFITWGLVITILSIQVRSFSDDLPLIKKNSLEKISDLQHFIHMKIGLEPEKQLSIVKQKLSGMAEVGGSYAQKILTSTTGMFANFGLVIIYSFFFLLYRSRFSIFILKITSERDEKRTRNVLAQISKVIQKYLTGVLSVVVIMSVLNTIGLLIIGVNHAVFFGILAGLLIVIPYIGSFLGGVIPILYVLITKDSIGYAVATAAVFIFNQFIEGNFITPIIVGSKVKVNPLATLIVLFIGGFLWGIAGMILFIPFLGVTKIIFDNVESLEPYGYLIGVDEKPSSIKLFFNKIYKKIRSKKN